MRTFCNHGRESGRGFSQILRDSGKSAGKNPQKKMLKKRKILSRNFRKSAPRQIPRFLRKVTEFDKTMTVTENGNFNFSGKFAALFLPFSPRKTREKRNAAKVKPPEKL